MDFCFVLYFYFILFFFHLVSLRLFLVPFWYIFHTLEKGIFSLFILHWNSDSWSLTSFTSQPMSNISAHIHTHSPRMKLFVGSLTAPVFFFTSPSSFFYYTMKMYRLSLTTIDFRFKLRWPLLAFYLSTPSVFHFAFIIFHSFFSYSWIDATSLGLSVDGHSISMIWCLSLLSQKKKRRKFFPCHQSRNVCR